MAERKPVRASPLQELEKEYRYLSAVNSEAKTARIDWLIKLTDELKDRLYDFWQNIESEA